MGGLPTRSGVGGKISGVNFDDFELESQRLRLRPWRWSDGDDFARMNAGAAVMADLGGPLSRTVNRHPSPEADSQPSARGDERSRAPSDQER